MIERHLVELALSRLLKSAQLRRSPKLLAMLKYVVAQKLDGNEDRIKAYSVAIDVFDRPDNFDPSIDPIVRTQAKRLRTLMEEYYTSCAGKNDVVRIVIPRGGYVPEFVGSSDVSSQLVGEEDEGEVTVYPLLSRRFFTQLNRLPQVVLMGFSVVVVLSVVMLVGIKFWNPLGTLENSRPSILRVFVEHESDNHLERSVAMKIADIASRFGRMDVIWDEQSEEPHSQTWPEDYHINVSSVTNGNQTILSAFVTHFASKEVIYSYNFIIESGDNMELSKKNVRKLEISMARLLQKNGPILADYAARSNYSSVMTCLIATDNYSRNPTDVGHLAARTCVEEMVANGVEHSGLFTALSFMYREEHTKQRNVKQGDALERALKAATKATQLMPTCAYAHYALMAVHSVIGNNAGLLEEGRIATTLNPVDRENIIDFASRINVLGYHQEALEYFDRVQDIQLASADWIHYAQFLAEYGMGHIDKAIMRARLLIGSSNPFHLVAQIIAAKHQNNIVEARRLLIILRQQVGKEMDDLQKMYKRRNYSPALIDRLTDDLKSL